MFNLDLAVRVMARIEVADLAPTTGGWEQGFWGVLASAQRREHLPPVEVLIDRDTGLPLGPATCHTAFCYAGWTLQMERVPMEWEENEQVGKDGETVYSYEANQTLDGDGVPQKACELLGIPWGRDSNDDLWDWASNWPRLFAPHNDKYDLYEGLVAWANRLGYPNLTVEDLRRQVNEVVREMAGTHAGQASLF